MEISVGFKGDFFEDCSMFKDILNAIDYRGQIEEALCRIRSRLKHCEGVTDDEESFLEEIREILWIYE